MEYKGFTGLFDYSHEDCLFYGSIIRNDGIISYEGRSLKELKEDFHKAVDLYLKKQNNI